MMSLLYLLLTLAILVVIHEYGHFWVARRCGVKVLKFSVGFGKPLWRRTGKDGTEYIVAAIPLGGYVKMLDEREGEVAEDELDQTFNRKPLSARVAIVAAGPIANLLFAVIAYSFIFIMGIPGIRPIIDDVAIDSPASSAGLMAGDEIMAINGSDTPTWRAVNNALVEIAIDGGQAMLTINHHNSEASTSLMVAKQDLSAVATSPLITSLGLTPFMIELKPIIASVIDKGAAQQAGMQSADIIVAIDGIAVANWRDVVTTVQANAGNELSFIVERDSIQHQLTITPQQSDSGMGKIGVSVDSSQTTLPEELQAIEQYGPFDALIKGTMQTWTFSAATLSSIAGMITGDVSSDNIGGPITIAQYASASADRGLISFISFLAMISISLGLLNLLPIPVLDGGHLAMYFIEWIRGEALAEHIQLQIQKIGLLLLLMLMFLAFFNDLTRLFG